MQPLGTGAARLARAAALSGGIVALAAAAHVLAHGAVPSIPLGLAAGVALLPVTIQLARRPLALPWALAVMAAGQLVLHHAFSLCGDCVNSATGMSHRSHAAHAAMLGEPAGSHTSHALATSPMMLMLHAVATVLTALVVVGADRLLWDLLARVLSRIPVLPRIHIVSRLRAGTFGVDSLVVALHLRRQPGRRGPPPIHVTWTSLLTA